MGKRLSCHALLGFSVTLALSPIGAWADFIIEFTDGREVTVGHYIDEGQALKIYAPYGVISFQKKDVKRIIEVSVHQSVNTRLETITTQPTLPRQEHQPDLPDVKGASDSAGKVNETAQEKVAEADRSSKADLERIEEQYQDASQHYSELWKKHMQDFRSGASDEVLAENRQRLLELDQERKMLKRTVRQVSPDNLPAWAQ